MVWSALPRAETPTIRPSSPFRSVIASASEGATASAKSGSRPVVAKRRIGAPLAKACSATSNEVPA